MGKRFAPPATTMFRKQHVQDVAKILGYSAKTTSRSVNPAEKLGVGAPVVTNRWKKAERDSSLRRVRSAHPAQSDSENQNHALAATSHLDAYPETANAGSSSNLSANRAAEKATSCVLVAKRTEVYSLCPKTVSLYARAARNEVMHLTFAQNVVCRADTTARHNALPVTQRNMLPSTVSTYLRRLIMNGRKKPQ